MNRVDNLIVNMQMYRGINNKGFGVLLTTVAICLFCLTAISLLTSLNGKELQQFKDTMNVSLTVANLKKAMSVKSICQKNLVITSYQPGVALQVSSIQSMTGNLIAVGDPIEGAGVKVANINFSLPSPYTAAQIQLSFTPTGNSISSEVLSRKFLVPNITSVVNGSGRDITACP